MRPNGAPSASSSICARCPRTTKRAAKPLRLVVLTRSTQTAPPSPIKSTPTHPHPPASVKTYCRIYDSHPEAAKPTLPVLRNAIAHRRVSAALRPPAAAAPTSASSETLPAAATSATATGISVVEQQSAAAPGPSPRDPFVGLASSGPRSLPPFNSPPLMPHRQNTCNACGGGIDEQPQSSESVLQCATPSCNRRLHSACRDAAAMAGATFQSNTL